MNVSTRVPGTRDKRGVARGPRRRGEGDSETGGGMNKEINPGWSHFSQYTFAPAILRDGFVFASGMTASAPGGGILCPGDIAGQTDVILARLGEILRAAGCGYEDVVATREFVTTTDGYSQTAEVRRRYFSPP